MNIIFFFTAIEMEMTEIETTIVRISSASDLLVEKTRDQAPQAEKSKAPSTGIGLARRSGMFLVGTETAAAETTEAVQGG
jgi:hypothetical protein